MRDFGIMSTKAIHPYKIKPCMELIILRRNALNTPYKYIYIYIFLSWLIGAEDTFTVSGLNCVLCHLERESSVLLILDLL